jgi:hypothetical protein
MGFFRVLGAIVLAVLAIGLAGAIFQTGYLAGVAADGVAPVVVGNGYGWGSGWGWGFGGGLFHILGFLFFLIIFFAILRAIFGGGRGGWGRGGWGPGGYGHDSGHRLGPWEQRAREAHDEWHRSQGPGGSGGSGASGTTGPSGGTNPNDPPSGGAA